MIQDPDFIRKSGILLRIDRKLSLMRSTGRIPENLYAAKKKEVDEKLSDLKKAHTDLILAKLMDLDNGQDEFEKLLHTGNISQDNYNTFIEKLSGEKTVLEAEKEFIDGINDEEYLNHLKKEVKITEEDEAGKKEEKKKKTKKPLKMSFPALLGVFVALVILFIVVIPWSRLTDPVLMRLDLFTTTLGVRSEYLTSTVYTTSVYTTSIVYTTTVYTTTMFTKIAPPSLSTVGQGDTTTKAKTTSMAPTSTLGETSTLSQLTTTSSMGVIESTTVLTPSAVSMPATEGSHFGFMHPQDAYLMARILGVSWERPHEGPFIWNEIEPGRGSYNWDRPDGYVVESQASGFNIMATIWPFASWDQKNCHSERECRGYGFDGKGELPTLRCKPCDMGAYSSFVQALVERYDGDGLEDMPGLKYPIKYWEAGNEPEMDGDELTFFKGNSSDYLEVLKETYDAVKVSDPDANVLHAGFAGMGADTRRFWSPIYSEASGFFDIANVHSVGSNDDKLFINEMKEFMREHRVNKPVWITEAQYNGRDGSQSQEDFASLLARSMVFALGNGAEKIFYTGLTSPSPGHDNAALLTLSGSKTPVYYAYQVLVDKLDYFDSVEKITGSQYKFNVSERPVWVLWGDGELPADLTGIVKVTDIQGGGELFEAGEIRLNESPVFIEKT